MKYSTLYCTVTQLTRPQALDLLCSYLVNLKLYITYRHRRRLKLLIRCFSGTDDFFSSSAQRVLSGTRTLQAVRCPFPTSAKLRAPGMVLAAGASGLPHIT
jgi:hypothetical protein